MHRLQEVLTSLLRHKLGQSLAEVETTLRRWRSDELGVFEAHAELLRHTGRAQRITEQMTRADSDTARALLRDAFDIGLVDREEFEQIVGSPPEEVEPPSPLADELADAALPNKRELVEELLAAGPILVHVDARDGEVAVPERFRDDPRLVLRFGYGLTPAIVDLTVDDERIAGTLTFGGVPFRCSLPWQAIYAVVSEVDQKGMVWPEDVPGPVVEQLTARSNEPLERPTAEGDAAAAKGDRGNGKASHLKLVK